MTKKTRTPEPAAAAPAMPAFGTIDVADRNGVALVTLNRPDRHNAFDETMIAELTQALAEIGSSPRIRAMVLLGAGESFCAGADLAWMERMAGFSYEENVADARALAHLLQALAALPKPTIARVHGPAYGGGVGLIACCDIAVAAMESTFALTEAKLGLIPATIGPYVMEAIGARAARRYFLTCERFDAAEAYRIGLAYLLSLRGRESQVVAFSPPQPAMAGMDFNAGRTQAMQPGAQQRRRLHSGGEDAPGTADERFNAEALRPFPQSIRAE